VKVVKLQLPYLLSKKSHKKYPLLILLDGDYLFNPFYGALSYGAYWDDLPEMIIVGISQNKNNERIEDSTDEADNVPTEKGAKFFEFIGAELLPYLEKYPIVPSKS
jgi:predicted alpha/beta superfamily hydrolase